MARNYPANTQIQKFLEESYHKERDTRLNWYNKQLEKGGSAGNVKSKQYEVFLRKIKNAPKPAEGMAGKLPTDTKEARYNKKVSKIEDTLVAREGASAIMEEMRPVTPDVTEKLFDGFTKEGKGRYQYLHARNSKNPEEKFAFPLLSSWEYGWRLGDVIKKEDIKKPKNGRSRIVSDTFYTRTGIPQHPSCSV